MEYFLAGICAKVLFVAFATLNPRNVGQWFIFIQHVPGGSETTVFRKRCSKFSSPSARALIPLQLSQADTKLTTIDPSRWACGNWQFHAIAGGKKHRKNALCR